MGTMTDQDRPRPKARRPICMDCRGTGQQSVARQAVDGDGYSFSALVVGRCTSCRGTGKAGA